MNIGVTATRGALTYAQFVIAKGAITKAARKGYVLHHGDCIGGDATCHNLALFLGMVVVIHPPENPAYRAWCQSDAIWPEKHYFARNQDIVDASDALLAFPKDDSRKGGTWDTIRRAVATEISVAIVYPNGDIQGSWDTAI